MEQNDQKRNNQQRTDQKLFPEQQPVGDNIKVDNLAIEEEVAYDGQEPRKDKLANDAAEQKLTFQKCIFYLILVVIGTLYTVFITTTICQFRSGAVFQKDFSVTGIILIGMTGSIPTILSIFIVLGLFSNKDQKDKGDDISSKDAFSGILKVFGELSKKM